MPEKHRHKNAQQWTTKPNSKAYQKVNSPQGCFNICKSIYEIHHINWIIYFNIYFYIENIFLYREYIFNIYKRYIFIYKYKYV